MSESPEEQRNTTITSPEIPEYNKEYDVYGNQDTADSKLYTPSGSS